MSHRLCKDMAPDRHRRGRKTHTLPFPGLTAWFLGPLPPRSSHGTRTATGNPIFRRFLGTTEDTRYPSHNEHLRKPGRRCASQPLRFTERVEKPKCEETQMQTRKARATISKTNSVAATFSPTVTTAQFTP